MPFLAKHTHAHIILPALSAFCCYGSIIYFLSVIGFPLFSTNVIIRGLRA